VDGGSDCKTNRAVERQRIESRARLEGLVEHLVSPDLIRLYWKKVHYCEQGLGAKLTV